MRVQRKDFVTLGLLAGLWIIPAQAISDMPDPASAQAEPAAVTNPLHAELERLPATAAGPEASIDLPLHFVPPRVQALQEMDRPAADGGPPAADNLLPFRF